VYNSLCKNQKEGGNTEGARDGYGKSEKEV
jgi:hypothetical protein